MKKTKGLKFKDVQPVVLFIVGLAAFGWQVFFETSDRPYLLGLIAAMIGLPFVIFADKSRNSDKDKSKEEEEKDNEDKKRFE